MAATILFVALPGGGFAGQITVFAAASLGDLVKDLSTEWSEGTGHEVVVSSAGSPLIARQVAQGAPADVVILANRDWMDWLVEQDLVADGDVFDWIGNRLVVVGIDAAVQFRVERSEDWERYLGTGRLAMALTSAVPAGLYGRQALETLGVWPTLEPKTVEADNVRAALAWVSSGVAKAGIVYATDAQAEQRVRVLSEIPGDTHDPIRYPVATRQDNENPLASEFVSFLESEAARDIVRAHGFEWIGG